MNIRTIDCTGSAKETLYKAASILVEGGWIDPTILERVVFTAQFVTTGHSGITYQVGKYLAALEAAVNQGLFPKEAADEVLTHFVGISSDDYLVIVDAMLDVDGCATILLHELTHAQQMLDGRLSTMVDHKVCWEGVVYDSVDGTLDLDYLQSPWEEEAYHAQAAFEAHLTGVPIHDIKAYYHNGVVEISNNI